METNLEVLNKISQKLGGSADATSVTESLNNIANALGDTNTDVIKSVSDSLNDILEYAGGGGGGTILNKVCHITIVDPDGLEPSVESFVTTIKDSYASTTNGLILSEGTIDLMFNVDIEDDETESYIDIVFGNAIDIVASDEVNCTLVKFPLGTDEYIIAQTDISKDASLTLTLSE